MIICVFCFVSFIGKLNTVVRLSRQIKCSVSIAVGLNQANGHFCQSGVLRTIARARQPM